MSHFSLSQIAVIVSENGQKSQGKKWTDYRNINFQVYIWFVKLTVYSLLKILKSTRGKNPHCSGYLIFFFFLGRQPVCQLVHFRCSLYTCVGAAFGLVWTSGWIQLTGGRNETCALKPIKGYDVMLAFFFFLKKCFVCGYNVLWRQFSYLGFYFVLFFPLNINL